MKNRKEQKVRYVTRHKFGYFFGERYMVFVKFPSTMTVGEIIDELFWAKTWECKELYRDVIVQAIVKPQELKRFLEVNKKRIMKFRVSEEAGSFVEVKRNDKLYSIFDL